MTHLAKLKRWTLSANESLAILDGGTEQQYRIHNRGPGPVAILDREETTLGNLMAGMCLDFTGDYLAICADGDDAAQGAYEPVQPMAQRS